RTKTARGNRGPEAPIGRAEAVGPGSFQAGRGAVVARKTLGIGAAGRGCYGGGLRDRLSASPSPRVAAGCRSECGIAYRSRGQCSYGCAVLGQERTVVARKYPGRYGIACACPRQRLCAQAL